MKLFYRLSSNVVFCLNILILFLLVFRERMEIPAVVQSVGRMHPLMLHLPIGILILAGLLVLFQKYFDAVALQPLTLFIAHLNALFAAIACIMGILLSAEGGYDPDLLNLHLITGIAVSILSWSLLLLITYVPERKLAFNSMLGVTIIFLLVAGHFGATMTHGENFVLEPVSKHGSAPLVITDSTSMYEAAIQPVLEAKCVSCHNERKAKGELIMTSLEKILKGGEDGVIWVPGSPEKSEIIKRVNLPEDHDDHMPPAGKAQLGDAEISLLYQWIKSGADVHKAWTQFAAGDSLRLIADKFIERNRIQPEAKLYNFSFASEETIEKLNTPFRAISQIALDEPALKVDFFLAKSFDKSKLEELLPVKEQIISLNLSGMPVSDDHFDIIRQFAHVEKINLNNTPVTAAGLDKLSELKNLKSVSLAGTTLDKKAFEDLAKHIKPKEIFTWNSKLGAGEVDALKKDFPDIHWNGGYIPDEKEMLRLTPPILANEGTVIGENELVILRHTLPGTIIRYTTDGSDPDSTTSTVYEKPFSISGFTVVKTRACKDHWFSSSVRSTALFKKGISPDETILLIQPDKDYKGNGAETLTDLLKGQADNYRVEFWLGYRQTQFGALFHFANAPTIGKVTVSYAHNVPAYLMPPLFVEVWGGDSPETLKLLQKITPKQPTEMERAYVGALSIDLPPGKHSYYKVIAQPLPKLPSWHSGKGQKGWFFVDEIFFN